MASIHAPDTPRPSFALTGRSTLLDPRTHAVRGDLADIRLAEQVFAPHYVRPILKRLSRAVALRDGRGAGAAVAAELAEGEDFELLDVTAGIAWGIAPTHGRVGYLSADALGDPA